MKKLNPRILYLGTPDISATILSALINSDYNVVGVVTQPDQKVGRKKILTPPPVKEVALKKGIPVFQPVDIKKDYRFADALNIDLIICYSYGQIIPQELLDIPPLGSLNLHGSLLPKYRGASPMQAALINRDKTTGVTLMEMVFKMDAGKMYAKKEVEIEASDNYSSLSLKITKAAKELILASLPLYLNGELEGVEQVEAEVTYTRLLKKADEHLDLTKPKKEIVGWIKALSLEPGAYLNRDKSKLKIYDAIEVSEEVTAPVGTIIKADKFGLHLQCKDGVIALLKVQNPGKNILHYKDFLNGEKHILNTVLE